MNSITLSRLKLFFNLIISALYAYRLASIPSKFLSDRDNYTLWYKYAEERLSMESWSFSLLSMEPLYYLFNKWLAFLNEPDLALQVLAFFTCFSFCFFALNYVKKWYLSLFLLLFFIFDLKMLSLQLNALRQGLATGFLLLFFQFKKEISYKSIIIFSFILGLIHFSFFLIGFLLLFDWWLTKNPKTFTAIKRVIMHIVVSIILSVFALSVINFTGAKQAGAFEKGPSEVSGLGFVYWFLVFTYIWLTKPKIYEDNGMKFSYALFTVVMIFYLGSYFFFPIFGRLIGIALPFALLILFYRPKVMDVLVAFILLAQTSYIFFFTNSFNGYIFISQNSFFKHIFGLG